MALTLAPGLTLSPPLLPIWQAWVGGQSTPPELHGLASALAGESTAATVIVASSPMLDPDLSQDLREAFRVALGASRLELIAVPHEPLETLLKEWIYQAAQGTGRGIIVRFAEGPDGEIDIQLRAIDSSARELAWRLASPHEADFAALRELLGERRSAVRDVETS